MKETLSMSNLTGSLSQAWRFSLRGLGVALIAASQFSLAIAQDCAALSRYIQASLPPQPIEMRRAGEPPANPIRNVFPLIPSQITLSIAMPADISADWSRIQRASVEAAMAESALPVVITESKATAHILVYFFRKAETPDDSSRLMSEFRKIPHRPNFFPGYAPAYDLMHFDSCWTSWALSKDAVLKDVTIFVPFEPDTGVPISQAPRCLREGLLKAFGVNLNRDSWTADCNDCAETDRRMAIILLENSQAGGKHLTPDDLATKVGAGRCDLKK